MADEPSQTAQSEPRKASVQEMIQRVERNSRANSKPSLPSQGPQPSNGAPQRAPTLVSKQIFPPKPAPVEVIPSLDIAAYPEGSLQHSLPRTLEVENRRVQARVRYLKEHEALQLEYEERLRALHKGFIKNESELISLFPKKTAEVKKKVDLIKKLEEDAAKESDDALKRKLLEEVEELEAELKEMKTQNELEFEALDGMWLTINASDWDMMLAPDNHRSTLGVNPRNYDIFESIRRKDDVEVTHPVGAKGKNIRRKIEAGSATFWALGQIEREKLNLDYFKRKEEYRLEAMARKAVKLSGVEDNAANFDRALQVLREHGWKALREAVNVFGQQLPGHAISKISEAESELERIVVVRVVVVDATSETVGFVMILDRNGRPCVGGLPKKDTIPLSMNIGSARETVQETFTPPQALDLPKMEEFPPSLLELLRNMDDIDLPANFRDLGVLPLPTQETGEETTENLEEEVAAIAEIPQVTEVQATDEEAAVAAEDTDVVEVPATGEEPAVNADNTTGDTPATGDQAADDAMDVQDVNNPGTGEQAVATAGAVREDVATPGGDAVVTAAETQEEGPPGDGEEAALNVEAPAAGETGVDEEAPVETTEQQEEDDLLEGYYSVEVDEPPREWHIALSDLLRSQGISVIDEKSKEFFKDRYNSFIPHITYQRIAGFQVYNGNFNDGNNAAPAIPQVHFGRRQRREPFDNANDYQIVDLGFKLGMEQLLPFGDYEQGWKNGVLRSVRHRRDGQIRFVGFNETGFGFMEDRPIEMHVQKILDGQGNISGVNIIHMTLFDMNDQVCFDTLYLKDDEDMRTSTSLKSFRKDAIGNRLAYRIVGQQGAVQAVLYPFQGRVKRAKLNVKDVTDVQPGDWIRIVVAGQTSRRLAKVKLMPTGLILGKIDTERRSVCPQTPFLDALRVRQRTFAEMPGLIDVELYVEDDQLIPVRSEAWPIECCFYAKEDDMEFMKGLEVLKEEKNMEEEKLFMALLQDARNYVQGRENSADAAAFVQEAENFKAQITAGQEKYLSQEEVATEVEGVLKLLNKNLNRMKRLVKLQNKKKAGSNTDVNKL